MSGLVYFVANDGTTGFELWRHVPATGVTERLTDANPGPGNSFYLSTTGIISAAGAVYLRIFDGSSVNLWKHDPGTLDTEQVSDMSALEFAQLGDAIILSGSDGVTTTDLWKYDLGLDALSGSGRRP